MYIESFRQLIVWQKSVLLAKTIYRVTDALPKSEVFGLQSQMRRASISIASNIAEGKRRSTRKDFVHFLHMAQGSAAELETQMIIAKEIFPAIPFDASLGLVDEIQRMLTVMIHKLNE